MARFKFGGTSGDFVAEVGPGGVLHALPAQLTVWTAETGGTRLTDLLWSGQAVTAVPVAAGGQIPTFQGPDGVAEVWVDAGTGGRTRLLTQIPDVPAAVAAAQAAKTDAEAARIDALQAAADAADISQIAVPDDVVEALVRGTAGAGPKTREALSATFAPANPDLSVQRDGGGRVVSVTEAGVTETYTYDGAGRVLTITRAGVTKTIQRDGAGRVSEVA